MNRIAVVAALALVLAACQDDEDLPEDPPLAVPGQQVVQPPPGQLAAAQPMPTSPPPTFDPGLAVPGQPSPLPLAQPQMPPGMMPGQMPPGQMPPGQMPPGQMPPGQGMQPGQMPPSAPISLSTGFMPDPQVARGMTVGQVPASSLSPDPSCVGFVPAQPSHVLSLATAFTNLRVLVSAPIDTVLVIRQPDGSFRCNDDTVLGQVQNPTIEGAFAPGAYTIWVGTFSQNNSGGYVIGFTELSHVTHATLGT